MAGHHAASAYRPIVPTEDRDGILDSPSVAQSEAGDDPRSTRPSFEDTTSRARGVSASYKRLVFTDPVAFRYLEEDESTTVLARRHKLEGYELYVVEQWICSRTHPTFTICTYTGDSSHVILVNVLSVPLDEKSWSKRLKIYLSAVSQSYAREKETPLGMLLVTNLSGLPSSLNVVAVPGGDVKRHREDFIVNENLKRMGCAGRAALSLQYPQASTVNKFHYTYKTSEKVPLYSSVMEIVRYCQIALVLYGKLEAAYSDGLLCDITEKAIGEWWNEIGLDFHNVEPSDGILGPTTVAALIGLMIGAYNRLKETGAPVGKDPVDMSSMKKAIYHFQRANKMDKTRRLDRATLDRLHRVTAKSADDEGLGVTRALKSTVAGLSGKGGEMIARGFGGGREKAGIAEVETLDIERLSQLVSGKSMKWLWQGKETKSASSVPDELNGRVFSTDDQGNFIWTSQSKDGDGDLELAIGNSEDKQHKKTGRLQYPGRINTRRSDANLTDEDHASNMRKSVSTIDLKEVNYDPSRIFRAGRVAEPPAINLQLAAVPPSNERGKPLTKEPGQTSPNEQRYNAHRQALRGIDHMDKESPSRRRIEKELSRVREDLKDRRYRRFSASLNLQSQSKAMRRSLSAVQLRPIVESRTARLPRHLSFSIVSDSVEMSRDSDTDSDSGQDSPGAKPSAHMKVTKEKMRKTQELGSKLFNLERGLIPFAEDRLQKVEYISQEAQGELEELNGIYYQHFEEYQMLQATSTDLVARERTQLNEAMRSIDMLGQKLDYELDSLQARMQEVEESVEDFEKRVVDIETSVRALVVEPEVRQSFWYERILRFRLL